LALLLNESEGKVEQIANSLQQPLQYDLREMFDKPLFKRGITSMSDLKIGTVLTGLLNMRKLP
jgi:transcriptional accessory protein Tex/SPT6